MKEKLKELLKNFDMPLFIATMILCIIGIVLVASASSSMGGGTKIVIIQIGALALGLSCCLFFAFWDYEYLANKAYYLFALNVLMLVAVLIFGTGAEEVGGNSWIRFGPIGIQPSELVKLGFILSFAFQLNKLEDEINRPLNILFCLAHIGVLIGLVLLQPDAGTAMVFAAIFAGMIFMAKLSYKYIFTAIGTLVVSMPLVWMFLLKDYQKNRIKVFFNPELDPLKSGYHVIQSKIAIGSGKLFGEGLFNGIQTQQGFLPARHTDFIFAVAGEELGFIGSIVIVSLLMFIICRCFYIASKAKNSLGCFVAVGVGVMFLAQVFENIGMTIGLMPVTGITLPFLSYGGSSLLTNLIAIGLVLNVRRRNKSLNF